MGSLIALYRKAADRRADGRRFAGTAPMRFRCNEVRLYDAVFGPRGGQGGAGRRTHQPVSTIDPG